MKLKTHRLGLLVGLLLASPLAINQGFAQDDPGMTPPPPPGAEAGPPPGAPGDGPGKPEGKRRGPRGEGRPNMGGDRAERILTPEERAKLQAAREKIKGDEEVKAAAEAARKAQQALGAIVDAKLLEADPSLKPILDKLKEARETMANRRGPGEGPGPGGPGGPDGPGLEKPGKPAKPGKDDVGALTEEERATLKTARAAAKEDPAVAAARTKVQSAESQEAKKTAQAELQAALRSAMVKANPETASILEKIDKDHKKPDAVN